MPDAAERGQQSESVVRLAHSGLARWSISTDSETSDRLSRVRRASTRPERLVRGALRSLGHTYRLNNRDLPGAPDIANRKRRWVIFVHGCFWHRHVGCRRTTTPKRNRRFWLEKFRANVERDQRVAQTLEEMGFKVLVIWECEAYHMPLQVVERLRGALPDPLADR